MSASSRPRAGFIVGATLLALLYGLFLVSTANVMEGMRSLPPTLTLAHELPQSDFGLFWCAGKGFTAQAAARFGLPAPDPAFRQTCQVDILAAGAPARLAWPYPPPMALLVTPFAALPLAVAFWVWRLFSMAAAALLRFAGLRWGVVLAGLISPAALHDLTGGQNGTVFGALLVAALLLVERRPVLAGVLTGGITLKPQMGVAFLAVIWRKSGVRFTLAAFGTAAALALVSLAVWGAGPWVWFWHQGRTGEMAIAAAPFAIYFPAAGITVFDMARSLGVAASLAWGIQAGIGILALALAWRAWRPGAMEETARMALTVCLGVLMLPHGFSYDLVAFSLAVAALFVKARGGGTKFALGALWLMGGYTITLANVTGLLLFPLCAAAGAAIAWRLR